MTDETKDGEFSLAPDRDPLAALRNHRHRVIQAAATAQEDWRKDPRNPLHHEQLRDARPLIYQLDVAIANLEAAEKRDKIAEGQAKSLKIATYVLAAATVVLALATIALVIATIVGH